MERSTTAYSHATTVNDVKPKIFDRYIITRFLKIFLFVAFIFSLISLAIEVSEKLTKFIEAGVSLEETLKEHFLGFLLFINFMIWSLYVLITTIFFASRLGKNNEILSVLNGGISLKRILAPFLVAAGLISIFHLWANHYLVPMGDAKRVAFAGKISKDKVETNNYNIHQMLDANSKIFIRNYVDRDSTAYDVRLETFQSGRLKSIWKIKRMTLTDPPYGWKLKRYAIRSFKGDTEELKIYNKGAMDHKDTTLFINPEDFVYIENEERGLTTPDLIREIEKEKIKGTGRVQVLQADLHRRTSEAVMDLILTVLAFSIASRKTRGGLGVHLAVGITTGAVFIILTKFAKHIALAGLCPVWVGIWLPNLIFACLAVYFFSKAQK